MPAEVIKTVSQVSIPMESFRSIYVRDSESYNFTRVNAVDDETLVPVIYALTGSNLRHDGFMEGVHVHVFNDSTATYSNCVACIDYRRVKEVREQFISSLINDKSFILTDISYVKDEDSNDLNVPSDFIEKKNMLADVQSKLPNMIRQSIERDKELGLIITN